jgi:uncharacterized protein YndB with AHSA1/START domain
MTKQGTTVNLSSDNEVTIRRTFDAPAKEVFEAWTNPIHVKKWWAPRTLGLAVVACDADVRVGGSYRYVVRTSTGDDFAFSGAYTDVVRPSRLVYTQVFESRNAVGASVITVTFTETNGRTEVVSHEVHPSKSALEEMLASGMEQGVRVTMDQLEEVLDELLGGC